MSRLSISALFALVSSIAIGQNASQQKLPGSKDCRGSSADSSKSSKVAPCPSSQAAAPSTAERFPYPGEASLPPPVKPDVGTAAEAPHSSAPEKQFPYPGEDSSSSSSSGDNNDSTSSSSDVPGSGTPGLNDRGNEGSVRRRLPKPERIQSDEDRAEEDLSVAKFYRQSGNLQAAYLRAKDAVKVQPADPVAHFTLAEIAQHLNRRAEAAAEYDVYLKLEPDGDQVKAAQRALATLK